MIRKYFPFCFYVLVSVLCLGKLSQAYPAGNLGGGGVIPGVTSTSETDYKTIDSITPLKIGDKIPDELWDMHFPVVSPHADNVQYLSLGDFRDKLIILDFWATWCAPCISSLHKLDTLQKEFADDLLVFPTSYEAKDKVRKFFADKGWSLPTAFDEIHLKKYFPHNFIPHYVWIGKDGKVAAMTSGYEVNRENIADLLKGKRDLTEKNDINLDRPIITTNSLPLSNLNTSFVFYQGRIDGLAAGVRKHAFEDRVGVTWSNLPLLSIFRGIGRELIPDFSNKHLVLEVADSSKLIVEASKLDKIEWHRQNDHTFEMVVSKRNKERLYSDVLEALNRYTEYNVKIDTSLRKCLTLKVLDQKSVVSKFNRYHNTLSRNKIGVLHHAPVSHLVAWLNNKDDLPWIVIDQTRLETKIDLRIDTSITDWKRINEVLNLYGLALEEAEVPVELMVIKENNAFSY